MIKLPGVIRSLRSCRRCVLPLTATSINSTNHTRIKHYSNQILEADREIKPVAVVATTEHDENQYEENIKNRILERALEFVPKHGWSIEALSAGAEASGYPGVTHGLFPNGGADLIHYFNVKCNEELVDAMKTWPRQDLKETSNKVPAKFIEDAIMLRLLKIEPYKTTWPKAMAIQTLPNNVPNCLASLLSLVDDICFHSGDRSVDFNWYLHRVGLAGIYKAAELCFLTDSSPGHSTTRNFVKMRIRDAELVQTALSLNPVSAAPQTFTAAFVTAKNILGINTVK